MPFSIHGWIIIIPMQLAYFFGGTREHPLCLEPKLKLVLFQVTHLQCSAPFPFLNGLEVYRRGCWRNHLPARVQAYGWSSCRSIINGLGEGKNHIFFQKKKQSIEIKIYDILRTMEVPQYWNQWMRGCQSSWRFAVYEEEGIHNGLPVKMGCDLHREDWVAIASWKEHL